MEHKSVTKSSMTKSRRRTVRRTPPARRTSDFTKATLLEIANGYTLEAPFDRDKVGWKAFVKARDRATRQAGPDGIALERTADLLDDYGFEAEAAVLRESTDLTRLAAPGEMAAAIAHEVKNPVPQPLTFLELLDRGWKALQAHAAEESRVAEREAQVRDLKSTMGTAGF